MEEAKLPEPTFVLRVPWGSWDVAGNWHHNPLLSISEDRQRAENIASGHSCRPAIRKA